jgi:hypothetical protein
MRARNTRVKPSVGFLEELRSLLGAERVRLRCDLAAVAAMAPAGGAVRGTAAPGAAAAAVDTRPPW